MKKDSEHKYYNWTLFLDRDGVINQIINNRYVTQIDHFKFVVGVEKALQKCSQIFKRMVVVTNQQGIERGKLSREELDVIHNYMCAELKKFDVHIDAVYYAAGLAFNNPPDRKPNVGMAFKAKKDFPEIDFSKSIMVGDFPTDMQFGKELGMTTIYLGSDGQFDRSLKTLVDFYYKDLSDWSWSL